MWTNKNKSVDREFREYAREMFRSSVVSLFWNILSYRKKNGGFTQTTLADRIGVHKSAPSRWFSGECPNWEEDTIADIATALDVELEIYARDRKTGQRFAPQGPVGEIAAPPPAASEGVPQFQKLPPAPGSGGGYRPPYRATFSAH
jgi:transcriptional regulator with XRE-family HTH domain